MKSLKPLESPLFVVCGFRTSAYSEVP